MKQWIAFNKISFSALAFSMVASSIVYAQNINNDELTTVTVAPQELRRQPVIVSPGMEPAVVPQVQHTIRNDGSDGMPRTGLQVTAPQTGIGGSNPGNANTGGVQVQSVTVQANPTANLENDEEINMSGLLRRARSREERLNEDRVMERLEQGRLIDERARLQSIEGFQSSVAGRGADSAQALNSSEQTATAIGDNPKATTINIQTSGAATDQGVVAPMHPVEGAGVSTGIFGSGFGREFKISPFLGYRWYQDDNFYFDVRNRYITGVAGEAVLNRYFSVETNFTFARDEMRDISGIGGGFNYGGYNYGYNNQYYYNSFTRTRDSYEFGAGVKVGNDFGMVRPFLSAGASIRHNRYNIDDDFTTQQAELVGWQRATNRTLGNFGGGLDLSLARNFSLGGRFDYQLVMNKNNDYMDVFYNDSSNNFQASAQLQIVF